MSNDNFNPNPSYFSPSTVKVDRDNNVWICYSDPLSGSLIKYDTNGNKLGIQINFTEFNTNPVDLAISRENNVWVACYEANKVLCYNGNTGTLIPEHTLPILQPSYLAVDRENNLWILHGYNLITKYETSTSQASSWNVTNTPEFQYKLIRSTKVGLDDYTLEEIKQTYENNEIWGGISVDLLNRVWAVNSETNTVLMIPATEPFRMKRVSLIPAADTNYFIQSAEDEYVQPISTSNVRSAQAVGDWTGNEWYQKFGNMMSNMTIEGESNSFEIKDLYKDAPAVAKINEDFDCAAYFKSLALPELLRQNEKLFNEFFIALVGSGSIATQEMGRIFYEKIANFNLNHTDVDTAEISQLVSLMSQLKLEAETYGVNFPVEIDRLINLFSIPLHKLRGQPLYNEIVENNIGNLLTKTSSITAGQYLYVKDRLYDFYVIVQVEPEDETQELVYPLSSIKVDGLRQFNSFETTYKNYYFFEYNPFNIVGYQSNIIDWKNPYTTITYDVSSWDSFYKDNGIVDLYFNNLLTKRLFDK